MKKKVCLITSAHLSYNPRLLKEADALHEAGYDVRVPANAGVASRLCGCRVGTVYEINRFFKGSQLQGSKDTPIVRFVDGFAMNLSRIETKQANHAAKQISLSGSLIEYRCKLVNSSARLMSLRDNLIDLKKHLTKFNVPPGKSKAGQIWFSKNLI